MCLHGFLSIYCFKVIELSTSIMPRECWIKNQTLSSFSSFLSFFLCPLVSFRWSYKTMASRWVWSTVCQRTLFLSSTMSSRPPGGAPTAVRRTKRPRSVAYASLVSSATSLLVNSWRGWLPKTKAGWW